jgi:hypothetical protein
MESAFCQGTALVFKEHQHLFLMTLADWQQLPMPDKVAWLEFVQLAQRQAQAHLGRQQETWRRFQAWARSGIPDPPPTPTTSVSSPVGSKKRKRFRSWSVSSRSLLRQVDLRPPSIAMRA